MGNSDGQAGKADEPETGWLTSAKQRKSIKKERPDQEATSESWLGMEMVSTKDRIVAGAIDCVYLFGLACAISLAWYVFDPTRFSGGQNMTTYQATVVVGVLVAQTVFVKNQWGVGNKLKNLTVTTDWDEKAKPSWVQAVVRTVTRSVAILVAPLVVGVGLTLVLFLPSVLSPTGKTVWDIVSKTRVREKPEVETKLTKGPNDERGKT